ncbi:jg9618 [Pararge aegeria aegeria]|uniref:NADH dehydrogenase [ubiquinone] 1 alpha subcomplex subunit 11 n=1 Tax=Pararge aegeria aegeria TaxID=348720 RepID=A0A8S4RSL6_9NEOP|nr:jg9618 [Pararge aegeria aegeria]
MLSYKYYDTPEGHDVFKKTVVTGKYAALAGLGVGTLDVLMHSHPKGFFNTGFRYAFFIGPLVVGAWQRSVTVGVPAAVVLGVVGIAMKMSVDENWCLFPGFTPATKSIMSVKHDWSLVKDIDELKTWTKGN